MEGGWEGGKGDCSLVFLRLLMKCPTEGSRVEEEAGFSFYLFFLWIIYCFFFRFPLCNIVQVICIDCETAFYTVFHNKVLNVHTEAMRLWCFFVTA